MKFHTKLWRRSNKSFATTIPHIALLDIDEDKEYRVEWEFDKKLQKWTINFTDSIQKDYTKSEKRMIKKQKK